MSRQAPCKSRVWLCLLLLAGVVRGGFLAANSAALQDDPDAYRQLARTLLVAGTFGDRVPDAATRGVKLQPTAYRPPLYPLVLAAVGWPDDVGPLSVAALHAVLGVATVLLVWHLAQAWGLGSWGSCAAVLVACDPILLNQSSLVMTETLATLLAVLGLWSLTRLARTLAGLDAWIAGAVIALAALCRPTFLVWGAAAALAMTLPWWRRARELDEDGGEPVASPSGRDVCSGRLFSARLRLAALFVLAVAVVMLPWTLRNVRVLGRVIVTTTHGGSTLWLGNNPEFYRFLERARWGEVWDSRDLDEQYLRVRARTGQDELAADRWAHAQAVSSIRREPVMFARACLWRVGSLWGLVPHKITADESAARRLARYAVGLWYAAVFALAITGVRSLGRRWCLPPWLWGMLLCLSFTAMHTVYWSNLRMRAPLTPVICLAAAAGGKRIAERIAGDRP